MEYIDLEIVRGDDEGFAFEICEEGTENLVNFEGFRFDLHIKPKGGELIKLSSETGEIIVDQHRIYIALSHDKTQGVKWETAKWDLQCINPYQKVRTLAGGELNLIQDVTEITL